MAYQLHINPEQVFKLTPEQEDMIIEVLTLAINYIKRPVMMIGVTDTRITEREINLMKFFSARLQDAVIFKWIDRPETDEDVMMAMEELQLYFWHPEVEEMNDYIKFHKIHGFPGSDTKIEQGSAWVSAMKK